MSPYKATDYDVLNEMLNVLKSGDPTVKSKLVAALNANFTTILAKIVHENNDVLPYLLCIDLERATKNLL